MPTEEVSYDAVDDAAEGYRSLSTMAVVALLLGLASPVALLFPLLSVVPLLALAVSLLALGRLSANREALTGRGFAQAGLALAVASLAVVATRGLVTRQLLSAQAEPTARQWIELVTSGDLEDSLQLTKSPAAQAMDTADQDAESAKLEQDSFANRPAIRRLMELESGAGVRLLANDMLRSLGRGRYELNQRYRVRGARSGEVDILLVMQRSDPREGRVYWRVADVALVRR